MTDETLNDGASEMTDASPASLTLGQGTDAIDEATSAPTSKREINYVHGEAAKKYGWWWGTGRRKSSVARVRLRPGSGEFKINGREVSEYFKELRDQAYANAPLKATSMSGKVDVNVNLKGGGFAGQAGAVLLGVARALRAYDSTLEEILRENDFLTRDARRVERKKYGQRGARRRFQFSKR